MISTRDRQSMTAFYRNRFSVNAGRTGSRGTYKQSNRVARLYARSMILPPISESMFHLPVPLIEKLLRPVIVYLALVLLLRVFGKRELAQLNPFDLVVLLSLSNTVQNAIIGEDNSVTGGIIGAFSLLAINWIAAKLLFRLPRVNEALEGDETVLIRQGKIDREALRRETLTE